MGNQQHAAPLPRRPATNNDNRILRLPRVMELTGLGRSSIYAQMSAGDFPRSISLGPRAIGWLASDIDEWVNARVAASRKETVQ